MIDKITGALSDLKTNPALLAVVILQLATLGVIYFIASANAERTAEREAALLEKCLPK